MAKKKILKEKSSDFIINFGVPIKHHILTLNSVLKYLEQSIKNKNIEENKIKLKKADKESLVISIDNSIKFSKIQINSLIKDFLKIKRAKYYKVFDTSLNTLKVSLVK